MPFDASLREKNFGPFGQYCRAPVFEFYVIEWFQEYREQVEEHC